MNKSSPSPSRKRKPQHRWLFPSIGEATIFLCALAASLLATHIYTNIKPYILWVWIIFIIGLIISVIKGKRQKEEDDEDFEKDSQVPPSPIPSLSPSLSSSLHQLPPPPQKFVGREEELSDMMKQLDKGGLTISGLRGMGGIGKTALALVLANKIKDRYPDAQISFDLQGTSPKPLSPEEAMGRVIHAFLPEQKLPDTMDELKSCYLSILDGKKVLILVDNARDSSQVKPLLPPSGCFLLVTSRFKFELKDWQTLDLGILPEDKAENLLLSLAPRIGEHAKAFTHACGYLPLALCLAGGALKARKELSPESYIQKLKDSKDRLKNLDKFKHLTEEERGIEASLDLSYTFVPDDLKRSWRMVSVFPYDFDVSAASSVLAMDKDRISEILGDLYHHSMIERDESTGRYHLHDLARDFASSRLTKKEEYKSRLRHSCHYIDVLREDNSLYEKGGEGVVQGLKLFDLERKNIEAGQAWACSHAEEDKEACRLCSDYPDAGFYFLDLRQHPRKERIPWLEAALNSARLLKDRNMEGNHLGNLGAAYYHLGEVRKAIEYHEKALVISREIGERRGEGNTLCNLGAAYHILGEARKAIEYYEKALVIHREIGDRRGEGNALGNLGVAYKNLGEVRKAIEYDEKYFEIAREIGDRRGEGNALGNLGNAYADLGEVRKAIEYYEKQLKIVIEIGDRRGEGNALWNMALAYDNLGNRKKAITLAKDALAIYERIEDPYAENVRQQLAEWEASL